MRKPILFVLAAALFAAVATVPVNAADEAAPAMPAEGQAAPTFTLPSQDGTQISLKSFKGKWVVLYFYPRDMTTGCTIEAHKFQDSLPQFEAKHAVILGVSVDSTAMHQQFCTKDSLTFRLLSDTDHKVVSAYGSLGEHNGTFMANRNTFLINPKGKIAKVWVKVNPPESASEVLTVLPDKGNSIKSAQ
ncbi:MAG TPA: peroxiredoxin [Terracidiphilus sp.]|nr:peroxiredoxin [Terracidiphilus sp.]